MKKIQFETFKIVIDLKDYETLKNVVDNINLAYRDSKNYLYYELESKGIKSARFEITIWAESGQQLARIAYTLGKRLEKAKIPF